MAELWRSHRNMHFYLADIRSLESLSVHMTSVDFVLHTAALKHVSLCESSPCEAVRSNIIGTQNVIDAATAGGVERVLFTSSDKAVNPTSVMGVSKLMGERLVTAASMLCDGAGPVFSATRFGNVIGSRGSVVPLFRRQIESGGPVTLTDPRMTRFIMTVSQAATLVTESLFLAKGGDVFVTKMPAIRIKDLAEIMIEELAPLYGHASEDIAVDVIGLRTGEKLYEELMSEEEMWRSAELDHYHVIAPIVQARLQATGADGLDGRRVPPRDKPYNSRMETCMTREELRRFLRQHGLVSKEGVGSDRYVAGVHAE